VINLKLGIVWMQLAFVIIYAATIDQLGACSSRFSRIGLEQGFPKRGPKVARGGVESGPPSPLKKM